MIQATFCRGFVAIKTIQHISFAFSQPRNILFRHYSHAIDYSYKHLKRISLEYLLRNSTELTHQEAKIKIVNFFRSSMVFKLTSIDKEPMVESPPIIYQPEPKPPKTKKYVIIGSFVLLSTALIVVAILVGIHIYVEAQKVIKFTLLLDKERSQDVTSDSSSNIVQYLVKDGKTRAWIVNDFNTDIKVTKIMSDDDPSCYITPLNRSTDLEPNKIIKPGDDSFHEPSQHDSVIYRISGEPVQDISFLNREARRVCGDVPTYWMYPTCPKSSSYNPDKLDLVEDRSPYYMIFSTNQNGSKYPCVSGCCKTVCACEIKYSWMVVGDKIICNWITRPCCGTSDKCFYKSYCSDVKGLSCDSKCA